MEEERIEREDRDVRDDRDDREDRDDRDGRDDREVRDDSKDHYRRDDAREEHRDRRDDRDMRDENKEVAADGAKVYVRCEGLGEQGDIREDDIRDTFKAFGEIQKIWVSPNPNRNFAFVDFLEPASADDAVKNLDGSSLKDRALTVQISRRRERGASNIKPGDWICDSCGINNFARRTECFKCRKPKPLGGRRAGGGFQARGRGGFRGGGGGGGGRGRSRSRDRGRRGGGRRDDFPPPAASRNGGRARGRSRSPPPPRSRGGRSSRSPPPRSSRRSRSPPPRDRDAPRRRSHSP